MKRNTKALANQEFDLVVVGSGIFGACAAYDAALRGLSVALIDRDDFGGATSAHSYKMIHGGIRYLQHFDISRLRRSCTERAAFLRMAPHLVHPLPIAIPTSGFGMKGKLALRTGMGMYDLLTSGKNRGIRVPERRIPNGRVIKRAELASLFPGIEADKYSGAAVFCDGQMYNPCRLVLSVVHSASRLGANVANHVEAIRFQHDGKTIQGVEVKDRLSGDQFTIRGKMFVNAAGPYAEELLQKGVDPHRGQKRQYSRDACFVIGRRLFESNHALAVQGDTHDPEAILSRGERHLFIVPWRQYTLIGVWHKLHPGSQHPFQVSRAELQGFIDEINRAFPVLDLSMTDVSKVNCGLVPFGENAAGAQNLKYGHRSTLIDHATEDGVQNLLTIIGVRYTTGRWEASRAVTRAMKKLGRKDPGCETDKRPLIGGEIENFNEYLADAMRIAPDSLHPRVVESLVHNYGTRYHEVLGYLDEDGELGATIGRSETIGAQVIHAVRNEMAMTLSDVLLRRTDLGTGEDPGIDEIMLCANLMAVELCWDEQRFQNEVEAVTRMATAPSLRSI